MSFKSLDFLIFFPLVVIFYFSMPHRWRWLWLLLASYYFYMCWKPVYVVLLMASTLIDYSTGLLMGREQRKGWRKLYLTISICSNLGMLFLFKYYDFLARSAQAIVDQWNVLWHFPVLNLILPVGISFYVFQSLSYSIDVYRGVKSPEKHLGIFALYIVFFPQLVAGPIERSTHLLPQFLREHHFDYQRITSGLRLMAWGFFKKIVIADRLAIYVNSVYNAPVGHTGAEFMIATVFFAYQIYCDFSGYSDIAIGGARVLGFDLMQNFRRPYGAASVKEFWQRWHISLSTWFRDYLYVPLGGNRVPKGRWYFNILVTFLLSGVWHGASWTFVIWGFLHGAYIIIGDLTAPIRERMAQWTGLSRFPKAHLVFKITVTFILVGFGWVFFRANSLADAVYILSTMGASMQYLIDDLRHLPQFGVVRSNFLWIIILELLYWTGSRISFPQWLPSQRAYVRWGLYYALIFAIIYYGRYEQNQFIYFQF